MLAMTLPDPAEPLESYQPFIPAPEDPADFDSWRSRLKNWRSAFHEQAWNPDQTRFDIAAQDWLGAGYVHAMLMLWDLELWDPRRRVWTVDALLDRAWRQFGGYDWVVLWNNYPITGIDQRNQYEFFDSLPGGRAGLRQCVRAFQARGVRVMIDYKPWAPGLPEGCATHAEAMAQLAADCGVDGIYLDCGDGPDEALFQSISALGPDKAFNSEAPIHKEKLDRELSSWLQMKDDSTAPGIHATRWLDQRKMSYESRRYYPDPWREIQRAWMNGAGMCIWENVFGYWAEYSPRFKSWMQLLAPAQRRFTRFFREGTWAPLINAGGRNRIYVSRWDLDGQTLWTLANRNDHAHEKIVLRVPHEPDLNLRYFDVITGREYFPEPAEKAEDGQIGLIGRISGQGIAGILVVKGDPDPDLAAFLKQQRTRFAAADFSTIPFTTEHLKTVLPHRPLPIPISRFAATVPEGMARIPDFSGDLTSRYRMRECGHVAGRSTALHVYDAFEKTCTDLRPVRVKGVAIDKFPVTNAAFAEFLAETGYWPEDDARFLAHWDGESRQKSVPAGLEEHPVVCVSLEDARAYARWQGKRLPTEAEWQLAATGPGNAQWPWGEEFDPARCNDGRQGGTTPVSAFPAGASPLGVEDLCGNTWEWTESEHTDGHTRYALLKGGCRLPSIGESFWLFDASPKPADWEAKLILLSPGFDRATTIGFRCAMDLAG